MARRLAPLRMSVAGICKFRPLLLAQVSLYTLIKVWRMLQLSMTVRRLKNDLRWSLLNAHKMHQAVMIDAKNSCRNQQTPAAVIRFGASAPGNVAL